MSAPAKPQALSDRVNCLLGRVEYRSIDKECDREEVYRLRYEAYLREKAICANAYRTLSDKFDFSANSHILGVYVDGQLGASIRIHVLKGPHSSSPAAEAFHSELSQYLSNGITIIDPNRFVTSRALAKRCPEIHLATLRIPFLAAGYFKARLATATVRDEHVEFYKRVLGYAVVAAARPYPTLAKPLGLMIADFSSQSASVLMRFPFFAERNDEARNLFARGG